ncbi:hypothetical protein [Aliiroseovarius sediminis]|uniref:hypothetical protein n=1 Tax=Aliiroseovarius sediminis TaxID=2925839 RepID=UPI001F59CE7E|nr:hypothetical protein [Aliiroseovarius sediminis]MCI2394007.1 hypothetical protein [Aliiroseovarius sediminis]
MRARQEPLFLARQSYRRRRLEDAARLLPILGAFLFLLPLLVPAIGTAWQGVYLFVAWFGLIIATALISRGLGRAPELPQDPDTGSAGDLPAATSTAPTDEGRD